MLPRPKPLVTHVVPTTGFPACYDKPTSRNSAALGLRGHRVPSPPGRISTDCRTLPIRPASGSLVQPLLPALERSCISIFVLLAQEPVLSASMPLP